MLQRYRARLSGPLLDRMDVHVEVPAVPYDELARKSEGESSALIRQRVNAARRRQVARFVGQAGVFCNAQMRPRDLRQHCALGEKGEELLERAVVRLGFSGRAYDRILKVARTIADLEESERIQAQHLSEAIQYRSLDRRGWG